MSQQLQPADVSPPGEILLDELEARGWTQKDLADIMQRPVQTINEIVKGTKQITPETALQLAEAFETSAEFWLNLENNYRLYLARQEQKNQDISRRSRLYQLLPVQELQKRSWIPKTHSTDELEQEICKFLGVSSLENCLEQIGVNFRCTPNRQPEVNSQVAWVKRVENLARLQNVGEYSRDNLVRAIPDWLHYSTQPRNVAQVPAFLAKLGIRFVLVPHLPKTYLDGAAFRLDNQPEQPVVALTLRHNRIDNFWFTLLHELAHIVLEHEGIILDNLEEGDINDVEREANQQARDWLIDPDAYNAFVQQTKPYFSEAKIISFAEQQGRHPGIVLGRLQSQGAVSYQNLRKLLAAVKTYLKDWIDVPNAGTEKPVVELLDEGCQRRQQRQVPPLGLDSTDLIREDRDR